MGEIEFKKVIFTSLGPELTYTAASGQTYSDGDVAEFAEEDYQRAVVNSKYAQDWTADLEKRTLALIKSAEKTRARILAKVSKLNG